ncbi:hypothetical protein [Azotobacter chroococcum]|uniref:hypothetical protein n=1 Tax=Azotobacter chroococcum TaxID=353 RepID=UPI000B78E654|nr:hypothetical protein [Azotobacter chroococcum]
MSFDVQFATTAETSLFSQIAHLEPYHGYDGAYEKLHLGAEVIRRLADHPLGYPISAQASELGITHYRELNLDGYASSMNATRKSASWWSCSSWAATEHRAAADPLLPDVRSLSRNR